MHIANARSLPQLCMSRDHHTKEFMIILFLHHGKYQLQKIQEGKLKKEYKKQASKQRNKHQTSKPERERGWETKGDKIIYVMNLIAFWWLYDQRWCHFNLNICTAQPRELFIFSLHLHFLQNYSLHCPFLEMVPHRLAPSSNPHASFLTTGVTVCCKQPLEWVVLYVLKVIPVAGLWSLCSFCTLPSFRKPQVENTWERQLFNARFPQTRDGFDLTREAVTNVTVASVFCIEHP